MASISAFAALALEPEGGTLVGRELLERRQQLRDEPLLPAEVGALEPLEIGAARDTALHILAEAKKQLFDFVGHAYRLPPYGLPDHAIFSACLATPTRCVNAAGSDTARSASILRLISLPAFFRPSISLL